LKQLQFETAPAFIILCLLAGIAYAFLLYKTKSPWSKTINWLLFAARSILVFILSFLLLGPIVKQVENMFEKPLFVILYDNSTSVKETVNVSTLSHVNQQLDKTIQILEDKGYDTRKMNLSGEEEDSVNYNNATSDLSGALKRIANRYEGENIAGIILLSDGIYNSGISPLFGSYNFPVYTVGVGDSLQRADLTIKNISYNKIAYQGNKFPVRVEVFAKGLPNQQVKATLLKQGNIIETKIQNSAAGQLLIFDFVVAATDQGVQKFDVVVDPASTEQNKKNNHASIFVEVVEGKKKILVVAPAPHPDIKALREVVDKNSNYEFLLHIPGLSEQPAANLKPAEIDLAMFLQAPDMRGKTRELFQLFSQSKTSLLLQLGQQTDLVQLAKQNMPIRFVSQPRDYDDVTPSVNTAFSNFILSSENNSIVGYYPPVSVHFGKVQLPLNATPLLFQRVGNILTDKPLLAVHIQDDRKVAVLLGEGVWRWRLNEFDRTENTLAFDELFGKLFQYLSTSDDKRKFRSYPIQQEFSDMEPVVFESQVYNDIFEPVYGNTIEIDLTNEMGKKTSYSYVTNPGNTRYQIGGLKEGVYRFKARTNLSGKQEEVHGEFIVATRQTELQNLTADFNLLRKLSSTTNGKFYPASQIENLSTALQKTEATSVIHSEERFDSVINLKWVFFILLLLVSAEWFVRKFLGSY